MFLNGLNHKGLAIKLKSMLFFEHSEMRRYNKRNQYAPGGAGHSLRSRRFWGR